MFIPRSTGGKLLSMLKEKERELSCLGKQRIHLVDQAGTQLVALLTSSNPWLNKDCLRPKCSTCASGDSKVVGTCFKRSVVFSDVCTKCTKEKQAKYIGESARSLFERGSEHLKNAVKKRDPSHIEQHRAESHPDSSPVGLFQMTPIQFHPNALSRLVHEGLLINKYRDSILNLKGVDKVHDTVPQD